jgi:hypothetical protein
MSPQLSVRKPGPTKSIKCDMCKKEFPANVDESILIHHVRTVHMNKQKEKFVCPKCEREFPTALALKYHTCLGVEVRGSKRPREQTPPPETIVPETPAEDEEKPFINTEEEDDTPKVKTIETVVKKETAKVIKKIADDWEDDMDVTEKCGDIKTETLVPDNENNDTDKKPPRQSVDKSEEVDEDQIVADVDDILKDTDTIMSDVDTMLTTKKPQEPSKVKSETSHSPVDDEEGGVIESLVNKKKP